MGKSNDKRKPIPLHQRITEDLQDRKEALRLDREMIEEIPVSNGDCDNCGWITGRKTCPNCGNEL